MHFNGFLRFFSTKYEGNIGASLSKRWDKLRLISAASFFCGYFFKIGMKIICVLKIIDYVQLGLQFWTEKVSKPKSSNKLSATFKSFSHDFLYISAML